MEAARWRFQDALNRTLAAYLHGTALRPVERALYPLAGRRGRTDLAEVRDGAARLGIELPAGPPERCLASAFRALDALPHVAPDAAPVPIGAWDDARHGAVRPLARARAALRRRLDRDGVRLYLHGSYATLDHTGYSDLDTLAVVSGAIVTDPARLRRCRARFIASLRDLQAFDPLQHHGHFVLTGIDLAGYPEPLFPRAVLARCVTLGGGPEALDARAVPCPELARRRFRALARSLLETDVSRAAADAYRCKRALSVFMLLPALWWQAQGRAIGKRESFEALYEVLPDDAVAVFRRAADVRDVWRYRAPRLARAVRRAWFNPLLPAALAAARPGPPPRAALAFVRDGLLAAAQDVAALLVRREEEAHARQSVA
jgi:hypothetical protein